MTDLQAMLIHQEGMKLRAYHDSVGKLTIGCGRNLDDKGISDEEALHLLNNDIADAIDDVRHNFSCYDQLSRARQMVLVSMAFNLGRDGLSKFVRFIASVHLGKWEEASEHMLDSRWAKQVGIRAEILARMLRDDTAEWI